MPDEGPHPNSGAHHLRVSVAMPGGRMLRPWLVLASIVFGFFMSLLDTTITNIALGNIQTTLKTDLSTVSWIMNAYTLTFAALLVTMGRLADQFGRKRLYMGGMILFSVGSLLCAVAPTIEVLIGCRIIQAVGASILEAVSLAIIVAVFPREQRTAAIGLWGALAGLAAAIGPVLGGFLLQVGRGNLEWRWIFFVNLPFCLIGLAMIARNVPEIRDAHATKRIDAVGVLALALGILALALGFTKATAWGWGSARVLGLFGLSALALLLLYAVEARQRQPNLDFALFRTRSFAAACAVIILFTIAFQAVLVILIQYFIIAQGRSPLDAALAIIWLPLAAFVSSAASGVAGDRINARWLIVAGMALLGAGLLSLSSLPLDAGYSDTLWREVILGLGAGLCFTSIPNTALSDVPRPKLGAGNGAYATFKQLGYALGVAIFISLLTGQFRTTRAAATAQATAYIQAAHTLTSAEKAAFVAAVEDGAAHANGTGAATVRSHTDVTRHIATLLRSATRDSFASVWVIGALFAFLGIVPALFTTSATARPDSDADGLDDPVELAL